MEGNFHPHKTVGFSLHQLSKRKISKNSEITIESKAGFTVLSNLLWLYFQNLQNANIKLWTAGNSDAGFLKFPVQKNI